MFLASCLAALHTDGRLLPISNSRALVSRAARASEAMQVATAPSASLATPADEGARYLSAIRAVPPPSSAAFDLAERVSTGTIADAPWRHAFRALATNAAFLKEGFGKAAFKLDELWPFAIGSFTMEDVERDVQRLPPQFVASGVRHQGGIYNKPFQPGFTFADVDARMDEATVVMLNAGFCVPKLAAISRAMLEVTSLPIWMNVYLSKPGLSTSTQLHTDQQDVLLVQTTGRKRWRVYRPPPPGKAPAMDPFARGKGTDLMTADPDALVLDTIMEPGQVLYIPAGWPHTTDTLLEPVEDARHGAIAAQPPSVHLTVGVDTHLWSLSYAHARQLALVRAGQPATLAGGAPVTALALPEWSMLHASLPVGFLAATELALLCGTANADQAPAAAGASAAGTGAAHAGSAAASPPTTTLLPLEVVEAQLQGAISRQLAERMLVAEPARWADKDAASLARELQLPATALRFMQHHREVLSVQSRMYMRAASERPRSPREIERFIELLMNEMDILDGISANLIRWSRRQPEQALLIAPPSAEIASAAGGGAKPKAGFGGAAAAPASAGKGAKKKR